MRLSKLKLSGFKSFVDPTTVYFPSELTGVVGPNGCGKSNVIDAVRWVMGESSAKHLRGDSMADVIFNGSSTRKPVAQASVELVFDNEDGGLGGQYANYNEISLRRQVTRDGQSAYFLNGTRCRRRDITDVFLGTGLGPRSYSIIEQGTISRLIEAKPEDLRAFLEEAAGISKYKERRRETEKRIKHTKENLLRVDDLRDEIEKQLEKLKRQARSAERFKELREQERRVKAELLTLRYQSLHEESADRRQRIQENETALEAVMAELRAVEADLETGREAHVEATDSFNEVQGRFYELGAEVARIEQAIKHGKETRQTQQEELEKTEQAWNEAQAHITVDSQRLEQLAKDLAENAPAREQARSRAEASREKREGAEQQMQTWQGDWDIFNVNANETTQIAQVERTRIDHLERHLTQLIQRRERIEQEQQQLDSQKLEREIADLESQSEERQQAANALQEQLQALRARIDELRESTRNQQRELNQAQGEQQDIRGRLSSLQALQQAALGENEGEIKHWLEAQGLNDAPRLAKQLDVDSGWERAVETALGFYLEAVCVDGSDAVADTLAELKQGSLALVDTTASVAGEVGNVGVPLTQKVRAPWSLNGLLSGVYAADNLNEALRMRSSLAAHESVVTRDGIWVGPGWLRVARDADGKSGVLEREKEINSLQEELNVKLKLISSLESTLEAGRSELQNDEAQREELQVEANRAHRDFSNARAQFDARRTRLEQIHKRNEALQQETGEIAAQQSEDTQAVDEARSRLHEALVAIDKLADEREARSAQREQLRNALDEARREAQGDRDKAHELELKYQSMHTEQETTSQNLERMHGQQGHLQQRREELRQALVDGEAPLQKLDEELEISLKQRHEVEAELASRRRVLEGVEHKLREDEQTRHQKEQQAEQLRERLNQEKLHWQEIKVRGETLLEQIAESGFELSQLAEEMPEDAALEAWETEAESLANRISRLGPINLAAIEEFEEQSERKKYLDAQHEDVTSALDTLENAIRKIDRETRTRFKETFDKVNIGLQAMFPRLFGGGHAYLELTGEDLLDTGVTVMARPPGKRNSTIHLLSGGEKALTAVALVFSIFELNPSPFCMLDEVDAPLDDANVGRFCEMVKEMSERVQFVFITHNKITMDLANRLTGVTMHEPGVSRLVSVDVDEAVQLAAV
ncbi:Chromosome partition protein smc [hydrothermal vent metagenome]|uniref:Chromosome partition protein smc n=1 Tax=hydrothermal vent metagenome TaxID=652676 RepID=A0A3B0YAB1_9ZZZZ